MSKSNYNHQKKAIARYEDKLIEDGVKKRTIRMNDNEYNALIEYQKNNSYKSIRDAIVSLIPGVSNG